jgi:hypothetical protein
MSEEDDPLAAPFLKQREEYIEILKPLFLPDDPAKNDIIKYFASLLRVLGMEDGGWDPYAESRSILNDLNNLMNVEMPENRFPQPSETQWRLGLLIYCHVVEMDAPFEVITNLLRVHLNLGYSPNPFYNFLNSKERKAFQKYGLRTGKKIEIIEELSARAGLKIGEIYRSFYRPELRNAVQHSDFILAEDAFRVRGGRSGEKAFKIKYEDLDHLILKAKAFISAYFHVEQLARYSMGQNSGRGIPYDPVYKGLMEVLVDDQKLMCGFRVLWPNDCASTYRRAPEKVEQINCSVNLKEGTLDLFVGTYAVRKSAFSPLVEEGREPIYPPLYGSDIRPNWPEVV